MKIATYLLLMTFLSGHFSAFDLAKIKAINVSPYDGVAVPLIDHMDPSHVTYSMLMPDIDRFKQNSTKHVWPIVALNRAIGCGGDCPPMARSKTEFRGIRGIDLDNRTGALSEFLGRFDLALRIARELGSPGVVVDPEPYNNEALTVEKAAELTEQGVPEIERKLEWLGGQMADRTARLYPGAVIWFLYTALHRVDKPGNHNCAAYIALGLLQRSKQANESLKVVSGGEAWTYCFSSVEHLEKITSERKREFAPWLERFPNLALAGTIAPWNDPASRKGWMMRGVGQEAACASANLRGNDFVPYIRYLGQAYPYVWIYAAGAADYNPYGPKASVFDRMISTALGR